MTGNLFPARLRASHQEKHKNSTFRRNGKLQACEPCRKGKLRCDHMMPTCGRCARRRKPDQCVYHPAPLTKKTFSPPKDSNSSGSSPEAEALATQYYHQIPAAPTYAVLKNISRAEPRRAESLPRGEELASNNLSPNVRSDDYSSLRALSSSDGLARKDTSSQVSLEELGRPLPDHYARDDIVDYDNRSAFISQAAVLAESELSLGIEPVDGRSKTSRVSQAQIDRGAAVLTLFKDLPLIQKFIDKWFSFAGGVIVIEPMVKIYMDGIRSSWQRILTSQKPAELRLMSERIWENTLKPTSNLLGRHTTAVEFCTAVTGEHLRWEVIGLIATLLSLLAQSLKDGDPIFCSHDEAPLDRSALALRMCNAARMCVSFCDDFGVFNDLYLWLLYESSIVYCSMRSQGSYDTAKVTAILVAALHSANLHQEIKVDDHTPFFMAELRKRLFICAYAKDKHCATFTGRPPRLTRQYCLIQVPLDLTDTQIMGDGMHLEQAVDEDGWNQRGIVQRCTFARLAADNALITEEILELSLGGLSEGEIITRATEIEAKVNQIWQALPDFLRIDGNNPWTSHRAPLELFFLASIRLAHLEHHFLLQRILSKKVTVQATSSNYKLITVCNDVFRFVVSMVKNKDYFRDFQVDFAAILAIHGVPSASLVAIELLRQLQQHSSNTIATNFPLPRSSTIQDLSVFISALDTFPPEAHSYQSCARGAKFLRRILDMILDPPGRNGTAAQVRGSTETNLVGAFAEVDPMIGGSMQYAANGEVDFVRWLDGMDWEIEGDCNNAVNFI